MGSHNFLCKMKGMLDLNNFPKLWGLEAVIIGGLCCNAFFFNSILSLDETASMKVDVSPPGRMKSHHQEGWNKVVLIFIEKEYFCV